MRKQAKDDEGPAFLRPVIWARQKLLPWNGRLGAGCLLLLLYGSASATVPTVYDVMTVTVILFCFLTDAIY